MEHQKFRHAQGIPLFAFLRKLHRQDKSKIKNLEGNWVFYFQQKPYPKDFVYAVLCRLLRDKPIHVTEYNEICIKLQDRYGARADFRHLHDIGFVYLDESFIRCSSTMTNEIETRAIGFASSYRDEELKKKKYQNLDKDLLKVIILIKELEGYINAKTRLRRTKNYGDTVECARTYDPPIASHGRCYQ